MNAAYAEKSLGASIVNWSEGCCELQMNVSERHLNSQGFLHGGVIATLLDEACSYSGFYPGCTDGKGRAVTLSLTINYLSAVSDGEIFIKGNVIGGGRKIFFSEGAIFSCQGQKIAQASGSFKRLPS